MRNNKDAMSSHFDLGNFIRDHFASLCAIAFKITGNWSRQRFSPRCYHQVLGKSRTTQTIGFHRKLPIYHDPQRSTKLPPGSLREKNRHEKASLNSEQEESLWDTIIEQEANQLLQTAIATLPHNATESWNSPSLAKTRKRSQKPLISPWIPWKS